MTTKIFKNELIHDDEDFSKSERKLSEGAVIGISVSVTLGGFLMLV